MKITNKSFPFWAGHAKIGQSRFVSFSLVCHKMSEEFSLDQPEDVMDLEITILPKQDLEGIWTTLVLSKVQSNISEWQLRDFAPQDTVGTGTFGRVILATHKNTGQCFAIKTLKKHKVLQLKQTQHVLDEKAIQISLVSPFIVQLYKTFQDEYKLYLILEYAPGIHRSFD